MDWKVESGKEQFRGVDAVKFIMAVCVIILHTHPLEGINHTLNFITADVLGRIAVPFFFMATGFLLAQRKGDGYFFGIDHVKKYVYRILKLYIIWTAIYLPVIIYKNIIDSGEGLRYGILTSIRDFIFVGSYGHLWYLPATAVGVAAVFFLTEKIGERWSGILLFFLFLAGLLAQSYYGLLEMWTGGGGLVWDALRLLKKVMVTSRNGIFFGSFFIYMGGWTARRYEKIRLNTWAAWLGAVISAVLFGYEEVWLQRLGFVREGDMYLMLVPSAFFLLLASLCIPIQRDTVLLRKMSMNMYFIYLYFKFIYRQFLGDYNESGWGLFLFTFCNTLFFAYLLCRIEMRKKKSRLC